MVLPRAARWFINLIAVGLMMGAIGAVVSFGIFIQMIPWKTLENPPKVDAVVVLTGGADRIEHGLKRFVAQPNTKFFITGVNQQVTEKSIYKTFSKVAPAAAIALKKQIQLGHSATNTVGNADEVVAWVKAQPEIPKTILLVTANYHMPRSLLLFKRAMPDIQFIEDPVFPDPFQKGQRWWNHPNGQRLVYREFIKSLYTFLHLSTFEEEVQL